MESILEIRCERHRKTYDNTDNECCWQVDPLADEVDRVLEALAIPAKAISDDWGSGWGWKSGTGVKHSLMLECADGDKARHRFSYFAFRRHLWVWSKRIPDEQSDFRAVRPALERLGDAA